MAAKEQMLIVV